MLWLTIIKSWLQGFSPAQCRRRRGKPLSFGERIGDELMERCDVLMKRDMLFLNPSLSLNMLAREMGTNRTYLSKALKESGNCSFCHYVNSLRVNYAKENIKSFLQHESVRREISVTGMDDFAIASGFSSARNFSRWFKMVEGVTPGQYVRWLRLR